MKNVSSCCQMSPGGKIFSGSENHRATLGFGDFTGLLPQISWSDSFIQHTLFLPSSSWQYVRSRRGSWAPRILRALHTPGGSWEELSLPWLRQGPQAPAADMLRIPLLYGPPFPCSPAFHQCPLHSSTVYSRCPHLSTPLKAQPLYWGLTSTPDPGRLPWPRPRATYLLLNPLDTSLPPGGLGPSDDHLGFLRPSCPWPQAAAGFSGCCCSFPGWLISSYLSLGSQSTSRSALGPRFISLLLGQTGRHAVSRTTQ